MTAEEDQPGPIGSAAGHSNANIINADDDDAYPLDESPEKVAPSVAFAATAPQASMPTGALPAGLTIQKPSPPIAFMCG